VGIEAGGGRVGSPVTFTSRLDPDDGINEVRTGVGGRVCTETSAPDVAPVTPFAPDVLHTGATLVNNEVSRETGALKCGSKGLAEQFKTQCSR
jgi:hypothetical protein